MNYIIYCSFEYWQINDPKIDLSDNSLREISLTMLEQSLKHARKISSEINSFNQTNSLHQEIDHQKILLFQQALYEGPYKKQLKLISYILLILYPQDQLAYSMPKLFSEDSFEKGAALESLETIIEHSLFERIQKLFNKNPPQENILNLKPNKADKKSKELSQQTKDLEIMLEYWHKQKIYPWVAACAHFAKWELFNQEPTALEKELLATLLSDRQLEYA